MSGKQVQMGPEDPGKPDLNLASGSERAPLVLPLSAHSFPGTDREKSLSRNIIAWHNSGSSITFQSRCTSSTCALQAVSKSLTEAETRVPSTRAFRQTGVPEWNSYWTLAVIHPTVTLHLASDGLQCRQICGIERRICLGQKAASW